MIPLIMKLRIDSGSFKMRLWIPLILFWPLLLALLLTLLPSIAVAWTATRVRGWPMPLLRMLSSAVVLLGSLRTTELHVIRSVSGAEFMISFV